MHCHRNSRLDVSSGPWGAGGDYNYDALGNIRAISEGSTSAAISYDSAKNRVSSAVVNGVARSFAYDARGNVTDNGQTGFAYDFANQPTVLTGVGAATYLYDGNLRRVKEVRGGKTIYTIYSRVTGGHPLPWPSPPEIGPPDRFLGLRPTGSEVYRDEATDGKTTDCPPSATLGHLTG